MCVCVCVGGGVGLEGLKGHHLIYFLYTKNIVKAWVDVYILSTHFYHWSG